MAYLAENSSNVSSSCPALLLRTLVLKADLAHPEGICEAITGACRNDLKAGLKTVDTGARVARRNIGVEAILWCCGSPKKLFSSRVGVC